MPYTVIQRCKGAGYTQVAVSEGFLLTRAGIFIVTVLAGQTCAFADYLVTYADTSGNMLGFVETSLQNSALQSNFLFSTPGISAFSFDGIAPSFCPLPNGGSTTAFFGGCAAVQTGVFAQVFSIYDANVFDNAGTFSSTGGTAATIQVSQFSGYLFIYQDAGGHFLAFSEDTPDPSGTRSSFLFASPGISAFSFDGSAPSFCPLPNGGSTTAFFGGCAAVQTGVFAQVFSSYDANVFDNAGTFSSDGSGGENATVQIVAASTPEPLPLFTSTLGMLLLAAALRARSNMAMFRSRAY